MALQVHSRFSRALAKEVMISIIWDSGATFYLSFDHTDFVGVMKPTGSLIRLQGIAKGLASKGRDMLSGKCSTPMVNLT
jgi:hypothetical protein